MTLKLLDGCCCAGLAARGYAKAGFTVTGVDSVFQANYPFEFIHADIVEYLKRNWHKYDAIHLSPPCQKFSCSTNQTRAKGKVYDDIFPALREIIPFITVPIIIENVMQAPLRPDVVLQGNMFGLNVLRKRKFELINWTAPQPPIPKTKTETISIYGKAGIKGQVSFRKDTIVNTWKYAMGVDLSVKIKDVELSEGIPPAYTEYLGFHLVNYLKASV